MGTRKGVKRPDRTKALTDTATPEDNTRYIRFARASMALYEQKPIDISDEDQVKQRIIEYFDLAEEHGLKPTVAGLCSSLGINRTTFADWCAGRTRSSTHSLPIKNARQILEDIMEQQMQNGKINPVAGIFLMSNNFGYKQKVDISAEVGPSQGLLEGRSAEELRARYADVIDVDAEDPTKKIAESAEGAEDDDF